MDLWKAYSNAWGRPEFSTVQMRLAVVDRYNTSLSSVERHMRELEPNSVFMQTYSTDIRYIVAKEITFDLFISIYDVSSKKVLAARLSELPDRQHQRRIGLMLKKMLSRNANLEMRAIGLQNAAITPLESLEYFRKASKARTLEIDAFGTSKRNIALDLKTGAVYNLLLLNRIYKPGELANSLTIEEFNKRRLQPYLM